MRPARVNSWRGARVGALVLTKMLVSYVMGTGMPATDMSDLEKMRDWLIRALPWAFDVYVDNDGDWPESDQHTAGDCDAGMVARWAVAAGVVRRRAATDVRCSARPGAVGAIYDRQGACGDGARQFQ